MQDRIYWDGIVNSVNVLMGILKRKPRQFKTGYQCSAGGILNAYREGDLTFNQAVKELEGWKQRSTNQRQRIMPGTRVKTLRENSAVSGWTDEARASRQWGVKGTVVTHHDSHGLSYEVRHPDGTIGHYDPTEIQTI